MPASRGKLGRVSVYGDFPLWIFLLIPAGFLLVGIILVIAFKPRPQEDLGVRFVGSSAYPNEGTWNAFLHKGHLGGTLGGRKGRFDVTGGFLQFVPEGSPVPEWSLLCSEVGVYAGTGFVSHGVTLYLPSGELRCTVSREHINILSRNTAKTFRERGYGQEFKGVLIANGARST